VIHSVIDNVTFLKETYLNSYRVHPQVYNHRIRYSYNAFLTTTLPLGVRIG